MYSQIQRDQTVVIFGAGASAASGTPLTNEILWKAFCDENIRNALIRNGERAQDVKEVRDCLKNHFHVPEHDAILEDFPSLTLLLSILDISIDRNRPFPPSKEYPSGMSRENLAKARAALEYIIFAVLDFHLPKLAGSVRNFQLEFLESFQADNDGSGPQVISLNYDVIADTAMCRIAQQRRGDRARLDYACDVRTKPYLERTTLYGKLLKLHGSLNWLFCPGCQALQIAISENGKNIADSSMLSALYEYKSLSQHYLCSKSGCKACQCVYCEAPLRPVIITPSFVKDYRNPHIQRVWYEAELTLRRCNRAYFIGYSLPDDDVEVIHLLRRGLEGLKGEQITVVSRDENDDMHRRYISLFGKSLDWQPIGFESWLEKQNLISAHRVAVGS